MKLKMNHPKLMALLLANTICLATVGCTKVNEDSAELKKKLEEIMKEGNKGVKNTNPKKEKSMKPTEIKYKKINDNICPIYGTEKIRKKPNSSSNVIQKIGIYQKAKEIKRGENGWSLVKYDGIKGYINTKKIKNRFQSVGDTYIEIDISDQKMQYYKDDKRVLSTDIVTGKNSTPTVQGLFDVYQKARDYTMRGYDPITKRLSYVSHSDYVLKFYQAYYIHDASWRSTFGGDIYKKDGSHGCVNTPYQKVKKLYDMVGLHTPVIVHK